MRTAHQSVTWLCRVLVALLFLGMAPVSAQAEENQWRNDDLLLAKHIDPEWPDDDDEVIAEPRPVPIKQVLIATETSRFKEAVVTKVAETLCRDKQPLFVKRIDLQILAAESIQDYQAIVLVNSCRAWQPSSAVRDFLKKLSDADKKKLVVLTTANSGKCDLKVPGVDAISAASKRTGIEAVAQTVVDKVRVRLAAP